MAFISQEELQKRMHETENLCSRLDSGGPPSEQPPERAFDPSRFRAAGITAQRPVYTPAQRAIIGATALMVGPEKAAEAIGCSKATAQQYSTGEKSKDQATREAIYDELTNIRDEARKKLFLCLGLIDERTLEAIADKDKARLAAQMANQLSSVIDKTIQKAAQINDSSAHLHLYAPEQRPIAAFDIKKIGEFVPADAVDLSPVEDIYEANQNGN